MDAKFWQSRWIEGRIGFHKSEVNPLLIKYFATLGLKKDDRILVPLCGKSVDMAWLTQQGYDVVGIELIESAVQAFFIEQGITPTITEFTDSAAKCYRGQLSGQRIELWVADIFELDNKAIGRVDMVYDRAALIALPEGKRLQYSEQICQLSGCTHDNVKALQLLITLNYDQNQKDGPPFSISDEQLRQYYSADYQMTMLDSQSSTFSAASELSVTEQVWLLEPTCIAKP